MVNSELSVYKMLALKAFSFIWGSQALFFIQHQFRLLKGSLRSVLVSTGLLQAPVCRTRLVPRLPSHPAALQRWYFY